MIDSIFYCAKTLATTAEAEYDCVLQLKRRVNQEEVRLLQAKRKLWDMIKRKQYKMPKPKISIEHQD